MTILELREKVIEKLQEMGYKAIASSIWKETGEKYSIIISFDDESLAPTVNMEDYFIGEDKLYRVPDIAKDILKRTKKIAEEEKYKAEFFENFKEIEKYLTLFAVDDNFNNRMMIEVQDYIANYIPELQMWAIVGIEIPKGNDFSYTAKIAKDWCNLWKVDKDTLYDIAYNNLQNEEFCFISLKDMIKELEEGCGIKIDIDEATREGMTIVTNSVKSHGARCLLSKTAFNHVKKDKWILPSSKHEVLLVDTKEDDDISFLYQMVKNINENEIDPEDKLCDKVFLYEANTGTIRLACLESDS